MYASLAIAETESNGIGSKVDDLSSLLPPVQEKTPNKKMTAARNNELSVLFFIYLESIFDLIQLHHQFTVLQKIKKFFYFYNRPVLFAVLPLYLIIAGVKKKSKGEISRDRIIFQSREIFNAKGIQLTLQELAKEMGVSISYITNHFRTKEMLFVSIAKEYETKVAHFSVISPKNEMPIDFEALVMLFSQIMDIQYEYRCAIVAVVSSSSRQTKISRQVKNTYPERKESFRKLVAVLVDQGLLSENLLNEYELAILTFQFMNLFTTWIVVMETYDQGMNYKALKSKYLTGIMWVFFAHLTPKGKRQFKKLDFEFLSRS